MDPFFYGNEYDIMSESIFRERTPEENLLELELTQSQVISQEPNAESHALKYTKLKSVFNDVINKENISANSQKSKTDCMSMKSILGWYCEDFLSEPVLRERTAEENLRELTKFQAANLDIESTGITIPPYEPLPNTCIEKWRKEGCIPKKDTNPKRKSLQCDEDSTSTKLAKKDVKSKKTKVLITTETEVVVQEDIIAVTNQEVHTTAMRSVPLGDLVNRRPELSNIPVLILTNENEVRSLQSLKNKTNFALLVATAVSEARKGRNTKENKLSMKQSSDLENLDN